MMILIEILEFKDGDKINLTPGLRKDLNICKQIVLNMSTTTYESSEYRQNILKRLVPAAEQFLTNFKNPCWYTNYTQGRPQGGATGAFCPGTQPERGPRRPHEGPPEYLFKRSIYSNRAVRSKYSNRAVTVFFRGAV